MPSPENYKSVAKLFGVVLAATVFWLMTTSSASAAFWFPLPIQPNPGNVPLPPPNQVVPNGGGNPVDIPPPDAPPGNAQNSPEPASVVLGLIGVGAIGALRIWRRRQQRAS
ncbi:MAG TPA: PEP-CTERM sorting domain-containing protein [Gemmataceae bacterium]|nr:PEP-CTERM sorting domain-containing protein [Gemmataceae bacterium]